MKNAVELLNAITTHNFDNGAIEHDGYFITLNRDKDMFVVENENEIFEKETAEEVVSIFF